MHIINFLVLNKKKILFLINYFFIKGLQKGFICGRIMVHTYVVCSFVFAIINRCANFRYLWKIIVFIILEKPE